MKPRHSMSSLVVIAGAALLFAGCGGGSSPSASPMQGTLVVK